MRGRYGGDQLSMAAILLSLIVSLVSMFFRDIRWIFNLIDLALVCYALFRIFSRNIDKRRAENEKFMSLIYKFRSKKNCSQNNNYSSYGYDYNSKQAKKVKYKEDKKNYKYMKCPQCDTKLRVPKGKGKLIVTCPKCHNKFKAKS